MEIITIEIKNNKAYKLLKSLEALNIIRVLKGNITSKQKLSDKYGGKLNSEVAEELQSYITESRKEWEK